LPSGALTPLQESILEALGEFEPRFVLTGGGALVAVHLKHRKTRDLDLFWRDRRELGALVGQVRSHLEDQGLSVVDVQTSSAFHQLRVVKGTETCMVDLVAEPVPALEEPHRVMVGRASILVDSPREILVNKLCALLSRSEVRDLQDLKALLETGGDLEAAVADAPRKDAGFSPLTLAWTLRSLDERALARALDWSSEEIEELGAFKASLIDRLLELSTPHDPS